MSEEDRPLPPVVVKKYANRRLYDTESSIYITLDTLADMVRRGRDFVVYDAKTGDDITRAVLTQIIMEEETRGRNMLPTSFLRQLIAFYGDSMQGLVPEYLERMMDQFAVQQAQVRAAVQGLVPVSGPAILDEVGRQAVQPASGPNVAVMERATGLYAPFHRPGQDAGGVTGSVPPQPVRPVGDAAEVVALREEVARLREELAQASASLAEMPLRSLARGGARH